jgi:hypothetical protein
MLSLSASLACLLQSKSPCLHDPGQCNSHCGYPQLAVQWMTRFVLQNLDNLRVVCRKNTMHHVHVYTGHVHTDYWTQPGASAYRLATGVRGVSISTIGTILRLCGVHRHVSLSMSLTKHLPVGTRHLSSPQRVRFSSLQPGSREPILNATISSTPCRCAGSGATRARTPWLLVTPTCRKLKRMDHGMMRLAGLAGHSTRRWGRPLTLLRMTTITRTKERRCLRSACLLVTVVISATKRCQTIYVVATRTSVHTCSIHIRISASEHYHI